MVITTPTNTFSINQNHNRNSNRNNSNCKWNIYSTIILLLILLIGSCNNIVNAYFIPDGQIDTNARCEPYIGYSLCKGYLRNESSIYVPSTYTQTQMSQDADDLFGKIKSFPACVSPAIYKVVCSAIFQECEYVDLNANGTLTGAQALMYRPCFKNCDSAYQVCLPFQIAGLDCSAHNQSIYSYPVSNNTYDLSYENGNSQQSIQCVDTTSYNTQNTSDLLAGCPWPLVPHNLDNVAEDTERGYTFLDQLGCVLPCPVPFFSISQWESFRNMVVTVATMSFVAMIFNIFTFGVLNKKFDRHTITVLFFSISIFFMMVPDIVFAAKGFELICPEPGRSARQFDAGCLITGIIFQFGAVSAVLWWSTMAFDLWLVLRKVVTQASYNKYYICIINGAAIVFTLAPLAEKQYGYGYGGLGCWILSDRWQNGVFWVPLCACLIVGNIFIILIIIEVFKVVRRANRDGSKKLFQLNSRPFAIVVVIFGEFIYLFGYHFYIQNNSDRLYQKMRDYVTCLVMNPVDGLDICDPDVIPYSTQFVFLFFLRLLGIEALVFYGISRRTKRIWKKSGIFQNRYYLYWASRIKYLFKRGKGQSFAEYETRESQFNSQSLGTSQIELRSSSMYTTDTTASSSSSSN